MRTINLERTSCHPTVCEWVTGNKTHQKIKLSQGSVTSLACAAEEVSSNRLFLKLADLWKPINHEGFQQFHTCFPVGAVPSGLMAGGEGPLQNVKEPQLVHFAISSFRSITSKTSCRILSRLCCWGQMTFFRVCHNFGSGHSRQTCVLSLSPSLLHILSLCLLLSFIISLSVSLSACVRVCVRCACACLSSPVSGPGYRYMKAGEVSLNPFVKIFRSSGPSVWLCSETRMQRRHLLEDPQISRMDPSELVTPNPDEITWTPFRIGVSIWLGVKGTVILREFWSLFARALRNLGVGLSLPALQRVPNNSVGSALF